MKSETPKYVFEEIEFCKSHPIWTPQGYIMVRSIKQSIRKDVISLVPLDCRKMYDMWVKAVGDCGEALTGGLPILQEFYRGMQRAGDGAKKWDLATFGEMGFTMLAKGMKRVYSEVAERTRYSFWLAFGITPDMQIAIENHFKSYTPFYSYPFMEFNSEVTPRFQDLAVEAARFIPGWI